MATIATRPITVEEFDAFVSRPENADRLFEQAIALDPKS